MKIRINQIKLFGYHGIYQIEKDQGQEFLINVEMEVPDLDYKDNIENTIDYTNIIDIVNNIFNSKRYNLLETLSVDISNKIMENHSINCVMISIKKISPPIDVNLDSVEVEYRNERK